MDKNGMEKRIEKLEQHLLCLIEMLENSCSQNNSSSSDMDEHEHNLFDRVDMGILKSIKEELSL